MMTPLAAGSGISSKGESASMSRRWPGMFRASMVKRACWARDVAMSGDCAMMTPVGRLEIEEIRGVSAGGVLRSLQERGLIEVVGRSEALGLAEVVSAHWAVLAAPKRKQETTWSSTRPAACMNA